MILSDVWCLPNGSSFHLKLLLRLDPIPWTGSFHLICRIYCTYKKSNTRIKFSCLSLFIFNNYWTKRRLSSSVSVQRACGVSDSVCLTSVDCAPPCHCCSQAFETSFVSIRYHLLCFHDVSVYCVSDLVTPSQLRHHGSKLSVPSYQSY